MFTIIIFHKIVFLSPLLSKLLSFTHSTPFGPESPTSYSYFLYHCYDLAFPVVGCELSYVAFLGFFHLANTRFILTCAFLWLQWLTSSLNTVLVFRHYTTAFYPFTSWKTFWLTMNKPARDVYVQAFMQGAHSQVHLVNTC